MRETLREKPHLHFVITRPEDADGWGLVIGITTKRPGKTGPCELKPNEHPGIKAASLLSLASLAMASMEKLDRAYLAFPKLFWAERRASEELIDKIQDAVLNHPLHEKRMRELIELARARNTTRSPIAPPPCSL
jgi:hypothetical protein